MYGNYQSQSGNGYQFSSGGNGNFSYQSYQGQGQINQGQPQDPYYNIFSHPNQNPNLFQQPQPLVLPSAQQPNFYYQNNQPPQQNPMQYFPPMPQYPQQQQTSTAYQQTQNQYPINSQQQQQNAYYNYNYQQQSNKKSPTTQRNVVQIPPELRSPANPLESKSSSLSSIYKPYRSPFSIPDDVKKATQNNHQNVQKPVSSFAYIPPQYTVDPNSNSCCSFLKTGRQPSSGNYYMCYTCQENISQVNKNKKTTQSVIICENCAKKCHVGHAYLEVSPYASQYCDCGSGNIARRMGPNSNSKCNCKIVPSNVTSCIMYTNKNNINQYPLFYCETCSKNSRDKWLVCSACASICHAGHKLNPAGVGNCCNCNCCKTCKLYERIKK